MQANLKDAPIEMDVQELKSMQDQDVAFQLLDVRNADEYAHCRIEGSTFISMNEVASRIAEIRKDVPLVVHCHHGGRSMRVVQWLRQNGYANATNLAGGIDAWSVHIDATVPRY